MVCTSIHTVSKRPGFMRNKATSVSVNYRDIQIKTFFASI